MAETKHKSHSRPRKERDKYPNLIFSTWETVDSPRQVIVSDMTSNWGQRHYQYLRENRPTTVNVMRMNGTLNSYLREVDEQADEMVFQLVKQLAKQEGVTEVLKRRDQMAWVGAMNNIRDRVNEIVLNEVIFV